MWKFVRGKSTQHSAERQKLQKELFSFSKVSNFSFILWVNNFFGIDYCFVSVL